MPKSVAKRIDELEKQRLGAPVPQDAPTRFDLYDLQRAVEALTHQMNVNMGTEEVKEAINVLTEEVRDLRSDITSLRDAIDKLTERVS